MTFGHKEPSAIADALSIAGVPTELPLLKLSKSQRLTC